MTGFSVTPSFPATRMRRNRSEDRLRRLVRENQLTADDLIWPIFVVEGTGKREPVPSMPGVERLSVDLLAEEVGKAQELGIPAVAVFPYTDDALKTPDGREALNAENLVCRGVREIKKHVSNMGVLCDVALDPYNSDGHDGIVKDGLILNDETVEILCQQSVVQAAAGCDVIAPSDMMDGRVGAIRKALDDNGFEHVTIMSYAAKYASAFYGPFRDAVGSDYPLIVRMNGNDFMPGGNSRQELTEYAQILAQGPADALCINVGWHEARVPQIVTCVPHGAFAYLSRSIKEKVDIPIIASHRINDPETARELLADGMCDMVAMGRSLISDPQLPEKARQGQEDQILHCIGCAQGCFDNLFKVKHVECLCNPEAGHEGQKNLEKTTNPKKVMVVGGGPGGMSAALAAGLKGHKVTLYEQSGRLGGQLYLAAAPPGREDFSRLAKDLEEQLAVNDIPVFFNQMVDGKLIASEKPDVVIVATGAKAVTPPIPGIDLPHVVQAWDVLEDKVATGLRVAIIGGGAVGVETALFLAEKGTLSAEAVKFLLVNKAEDPEVLYEMATQGSKKIVLVEMLDKMGKDIGKSTRWGMMQELSRAGIISVTEHTVTEITPDGLTMEKAGAIVKIEADTIVVAAGSAPVNSLESVLKEMQVPFKVVGDAKQVALAFDAVHQGYAAGLSL